ncbi:MAG: carboxypeptidase regulatory-like domain-containing protein [Bryobacteraceae bacterium]
MKEISCVTGLLLLLCAALWSQGQSDVTGVVADPTGATIPMANVKLLNPSTNVEYTATTTDAGVYRFVHIPAGEYRITVTAPGFKSATISPVLVNVSGVVNADFKLEVGNATESITVSSENTLLETASSTIGRGVSPEEFHTWPIFVDDGQRQIQSFIFRSLPGTSGDSYQGTINGGQMSAHEVLIEGISVGRADLAGSTAEFSPSADSISESRLETGNMSAQYGGGQTAVANFNIRSGTNKLHGTAYEYLMNDKLNAAGFMNNAQGSAKTPFRQNSFGGTIGGPVMLPKVHDGRNRTFFFFSYEGDRRRNYTLASPRTVPVNDFRTGDFSRLLNPSFTGNAKSGTQVGTDPLGRAVVFGAIYDPASTSQVNGKWIRETFPGNVIPQSRFSKVSAAILKQAPIPSPQVDSFLRNIPGTPNSPVFSLNTYGGKLDQVFSNAHRMSVFVNTNDRTRYNGASNGYAPVPGSASGPFNVQNVQGWFVRASEDWVITPTALNHFGFGYNRLVNANNSYSRDQDWPSKIGLNGVAQTTFPQISWNAPSATLGSSLVRLGRSGAGKEPNGSWIFQDDFTMIRGRHTIKFGAEVRRYFYNEDPSGNTSGSYTFSSYQTAEPNNTSATGFSFASFMLGAVRNATLNILAVKPESRVMNPAFYVSDDWRASSKLTLNLGLRWDIVGALREVGDRMSGLSLTTPNPDAANYPGALVFIDELGRSSFQDSYYRQLGPRVGFAYHLHSKAVLRGGYGVNFAAPIRNGWGMASITGYNGSNNYGAVGTREPRFYWDNGYPAYSGTLPNTDPSQQNGSDIGLIRADSSHQPYVQNWTFGIQWLLPADSVLETTYVGNKGTRLMAQGYSNIQQLPVKYLSLGDTLLDDVADHPEIPLPYAGFEGSVAQALRPLPQYSGAYDLYPNWGNSSYHAFQAVLRKRLNRGISYLVSYTYSKVMTDSDSAIDATSTQDVYNRRLDRSVASFDQTHGLRLTWVYELPFGKGKRFLSHGGWTNVVLGGWTVTGIQGYNSGDPLSISTEIDTSASLFNSVIRGDIVPGVKPIADKGGVDFKNGTQYLNPEAFASPPTTDGGVPLRLGTAPRYLGNVRGPVRVSEDFGVFKRFGFGEGRDLEFRTDFLNAFNRAGRANPDTDLDSGFFGLIMGSAYSPRTTQLSLRLSF